MARKLIETIKNETLGNVAKVYRDAEWNEYVVVFCALGVKQEGADYHTDDKEDAINTARVFVAAI